MEVNTQTGALTRISSSTVVAPGLSAPLAADPSGRFVYLAYGNGLRSYLVDKTSGQLSERSRVEPDGSGSALSIAASERQVYCVIGVSKGGFGGHSYWRAYPVDTSTGALSEPQSLPSHFEPNTVVADPGGRYVYTDGIGAFFISNVQPDGTVVDAENRDLPLGWPLFAALGPGFLAVTDDYGNLLTAAIDGASGGIAPGQRVTQAFGDAYRGSMNTPEIAVASTGLIGILGLQSYESGPGASAWSLQMWRVDAAGTLDRRAEVSLPPDVARHLAFDPSGRFLYVAGWADGIRAFAVAADGQLRETGAHAIGTGPIVMISR